MATYVHAPDFDVCRFHKNASALLQSMSAFFSRDNVGLAGIAHYFKASDALIVGGTCSVAWCCNVLQRRRGHPCLCLGCQDHWCSASASCVEVFIYGTTQSACAGAVSGGDQRHLAVH